MQTVHVLRGGLAVCRFSNQVPAEWPVGHVFTDISDLRHITCPDCLLRAKHSGIKLEISEEFVHKVEQATDPCIAADMLLKKSVDEACATIDRMNIVRAALVLNMLQVRDPNNLHAQAIVQHAKRLGIRASEGPVAARNQHFRETGEFFV